MSDQGERGATGQRGVAGERGPKGDHGQQGDTGATEPMRLWLGVRKSVWMLAAFLLVIGSGAYANYKTGAVAKDFARQQRTDALARGRSNCEAINTATERLRNVVIVATAGTGGVDYTTIPEFKRLDRPMQEFLVALRARTAAPAESPLRAQLLNGLDLRDCAAEYPTKPPPPP